MVTKGTHTPLHDDVAWVDQYMGNQSMNCEQTL